MCPAESRPLTRQGKGGLRIAQLARLVSDVHHADCVMGPAEARLLARQGKGGLRIAQLARLVYDVHHADLAMGPAEARPLARQGKGGSRVAQLAYPRHRISKRMTFKLIKILARGYLNLIFFV